MAGSSMRSTVIVAVGARGRRVGATASAPITTRSRQPFSFCGNARVAGVSAESRLLTVKSPPIKLALAGALFVVST